jgi:hypothetical protein
LLEGWGHEFRRGVYVIKSEWDNFMFRNRDKQSFDFSVKDLLRFKLELSTIEEIW